MNKIIMATAAIALLSSSAVFGAEPSASTATPNSGVGVKGAPGSTNGPADSNANGATANPNNSTGNSASGGAGSGEQGAGTDPSQDATGVKGAQDSTNGPSTKKPGDNSTSK